MQRSAFHFILLSILGASSTGTTLSSAQAIAADHPPAHWVQPQSPIKLFANTHYVGTRGLSSVLVTSAEGHVLIDTGLPQSADVIAQNIRTLGFELGDVKWILNSHAHSDHAGGIAMLQQMTGAKVASSAYGAQTMQAGRATNRDPQYSLADSIPKVAAVEVLEDRQTLSVGNITLTMHSTPGHTPGGTSWTWRSCEQNKCRNFVYADSLSAVSDSTFKYGGDDRYPDALEDFRRTLARIASLECDILITPHPEASDLWSRIDSSALVDATACKRYADQATAKLESRLRDEATQRKSDRR